MEVSKNKTISDFQKEFNDAYRGLKIVFYKSNINTTDGWTESNQLSPETKLGEAYSDIREGELNIYDYNTIADVESIFSKEFKINVQIFRRSNKLWLQTSKTDKWTVGTQNSKGLHSIQK